MVLHSLPPILRRRYFRYGTLFVVLTVPCMLVLFGQVGMGGPRPWRMFGPSVLAFSPFFITYTVASILRFRLRRAFLAAEGRLCTECGYDLRSSGDAGTCPECGVAFDTASDRRRWATAGFIVSSPAAARPLHGRQEHGNT